MTTMYSPEAVLDMVTRLKTGQGLRLVFSVSAKARAFKFRLYHLRRQERERSKAVYDAADPKWNHSPWDRMSVVQEGRVLNISIGPLSRGARKPISPIEIIPTGRLP